MAGTGTDTSGISPGPFLVGVLSIVGALGVGLSIALSLYESLQFGGRSVVDLLVEFPLSYVGLPGITIVGWLIVGVVLLFGHAVSVRIGAVAYLGAVFVNLVVLVSEPLGVRPVFLWYVDPVTPLVTMPLQVLRIAGVAPLGFRVSFYVPGIVGTAASLLLGVYLAASALRDST